MTRFDWDRKRPPPGSPRLGHGQPPTRSQLEYLAALAQRAGEALAPPTTRAHASREIDRLCRKLRR